MGDDCNMTKGYGLFVCWGCPSARGCSGKWMVLFMYAVIVMSASVILGTLAA